MTYSARFNLIKFFTFLILSVFYFQTKVEAQIDNNASADSSQASNSGSTITTSGTNSPVSTQGTASPSANVSTATTGGTNVNYQTNNAYNNENGFAPGIFCRTPTMYLGGNYGNADQNNIDTASNPSSASSTSYQANIGVLIPFGSSILKNCADLANQITIDRKISTELSMIRACAGLEKDGIIVDPEIYPFLEKCARRRVLGRTATVPGSKPLGSNIISPQFNKVPKTNKL